MRKNINRIEDLVAGGLGRLLVAGVGFWLSICNLALASPDAPVVLIPGILGSKLCTTSSPPQVVWGNVDSLWNFNRLRIGTGSDEQLEPCGIVDRIEVVGPFSIGQYDDLLATLHSLGYVEDQNLFVFDYDWRLDNQQNAARLAAFIQQHIPNGQFDIIAHSMGGIVARIYLQHPDSAGRVRRLVEMGTPHFGAASALYTAFNGWEWWKNALAGGLGEVRATLLTFPSIYQLMPHYSRCCWLDSDSGSSEFNIFDPGIWEQYDWLTSNISSGAGLQTFEANLHHAADIFDLLKQPLPKSVQWVPVVTGVIDTQWRVHVDAGTGTFNRWETNFGDGTVYEWSAANGDLIDAKPSDTEHARIFASASARTTLRWALVSGNVEHAGAVVGEYRAVTIDRQGRRILVRRVSLTVSPELALAGDTVTITIAIDGEAALATTDLDVGIATVRDGTQVSLPVTRTTDGATVSFTATFAAASGDSPTIVAARIPGLPETLQKPLVVLPRP